MRSAISNTTFNRATVSRKAGLALPLEQFEYDVDGKDVDVFHAASLNFFPCFSHATALNKDEC